MRIERLRVVFPVLIGAALLASSCSQSATAPDGLSASGSLNEGTGASDKRHPGSEIRGTVEGLTGSCPDLTFTLGGVVVHTGERTHFMGGTCADVVNGATAGAAGEKAPDGSLHAKAVKLGDGPRPGPKPGVSLGGPIRDLGGSCPSITFVIDKHHVSTNGDTKFEGKACGDLQNGDPVKVRGVVQDDRSVLAKGVAFHQR